MHTEPGGGALHVDLGPVVLSKASVGEQDNCVYVLTCAATGAQLLVDAADDAPAVLALVEEAAHVSGRAATDLVGVVTTHGHWDHHRALPAVVAATGAPALVGRDDAGDLPVAADRLLDHGDVVEVGELVVAVVHLRGHTPGSVALVVPGAAPHPTLALTGDSLFPGGVGNTRGDAARFTSLLDDVTDRLFGLDDSTLVQPGHGDGTTLGAERGSLEDWRSRGW
ncbi:MBL fold metallo-hydrolase [Aquipuribacter hungaricus]|uniref:MBL fold metallo-hydrolase n=1 Tax=Aquipuribacter hungaricus TaxID=545624 RepID=A0ABV7WEP1_9MICO